MGKKFRVVVIELVAVLGFLLLLVFAGQHQFWGLPQYAADKFVSIVGEPPDSAVGEQP